MLLRNDSFRDAFREFDNWASRGLAGQWSDGERWMALDSYRHGDVVTLLLDLPGVDPASIDFTVQRNELKVEAERQTTLPDGAQYLMRERPSGRFTRRLFVSDNLDTDHVDAQYEHGVLTIRLPLRETAKPRRVDIKAGEPQAAIEANAS